MTSILFSIVAIFWPLLILIVSSAQIDVQSLKSNREVMTAAITSLL